MKIIDTHAHLDHLENLKEALENASQAGVASIVAVSEDLASCQKNLEIKDAGIFPSPKIYIAMGIHPSHADESQLDECLDFVRERAEHLKAIGEIGLDFWYPWVKKNPVQKEVQKKVFCAFLGLAKELNLPVIIHSRGAWKECFDATQKMEINKAVFHWYSGPGDVLENILSKGYFISATPSLAYSPQCQEAIGQTPVEQILIETDSPVFFKNKATGEGFRAQPKDVFRTLRIISEKKEKEESEMLSILNDNAKRFFHLI